MAFFLYIYKKYFTMKRLIILLFSFFTCSIIYSQISDSFNRYLSEISPSKYECIYDYITHQQDKNGDSIDVNRFTVLQIGETICKFEDYTAFQYDSVLYVDAPAEIKDNYAKQFVGVSNYFDSEIFQNIGENSMNFMECVGLNYYTYDEKFAPMDWHLEDDTITVCGYHCNKATTEYGGRKWIAWYTSELPISNGPWKLCGLPGLILQAHDSENIHNFTAFSFRKCNTPILRIKSSKIQKLKNREAFLDIKNKFVNDKNTNILEKLGGNITSVIQSQIDSPSKELIINGVVLHFHLDGYVPLELK